MRVSATARRIGAATAAAAALFAGGLILVRPSLLVVSVLAAVTGLLIGAGLGAVRARDVLREALRAHDARPHGHRPAWVALAVLAVLGSVTAAALVPGGSDRQSGATGSRGPTPCPPACPGNGPHVVDTVSPAAYSGVATLSPDAAHWRVVEHFTVDAATLAHGARISEAKLGRRLADIAARLEEGRSWTVAVLDGGLRIGRSRTRAANVRGFPHLLTANRAVVPRIHWSPGASVSNTITAAKGSVITLRAPRRMVRNTDPASTSRDVASGRAATQLVLTEDAGRDRLTTVDFDLANGVARSAPVRFLRSASLWKGVTWLLGTDITVLMGAVAAVMVPRYVARRFPLPAEQPARAVA